MAPKSDSHSSFYRYEPLPPSPSLFSPQKPPAYSKFCQHCALFSSALLTVSRPVLKALAQTTVPVLKVLLTPAYVAPTAATALLPVVGSSGFFTLFFALLQYPARRPFFPQLKQFPSNLWWSPLFFPFPRFAVTVPFDADNAFESCVAA